MMVFFAYLYIMLNSSELLIIKYAIISNDVYWMKFPYWLFIHHTNSYVNSSRFLIALSNAHTKLCELVFDASFNPRIIFVLIVNPWKLLFFLHNWMWLTSRDNKRKVLWNLNSGKLRNSSLFLDSLWYSILPQQCNNQQWCWLEEVPYWLFLHYTNLSELLSILQVCNNQPWFLLEEVPYWLFLHYTNLSELLNILQVCNNQQWCWLEEVSY